MFILSTVPGSTRFDRRLNRRAANNKILVFRSRSSADELLELADNCLVRKYIGRSSAADCIGLGPRLSCFFSC